MHPDALGRPGEGVHFHVLGVAVVDLLLTALAAYAIGAWTGYGFLPVFAAAMLLGLLVHRALGVRTTLTKAVFG